MQTTAAERFYQGFHKKINGQAKLGWLFDEMEKQGKKCFKGMVALEGLLKTDSRTIRKNLPGFFDGLGSGNGGSVLNLEESSFEAIREARAAYEKLAGMHWKDRIIAKYVFLYQLKKDKLWKS